jgi:PKD repeat protein
VTGGIHGRLIIVVVAAVALGLLASSLAFLPASSHVAPPANAGRSSDAPRAAAGAFRELSADAQRSSFPPAGSGTWINLTKNGRNASPPGALWNSVAYDPADQEVVDFGGCAPTDCSENFTWVFSDGTWTNITDLNDSPPARVGATMDYDPNMGGVLLFGGAGSSGYLNDTWLFSGGRWTNLSWVGPAPPARVFASMAFDPDPAENGSVLWGGYSLSLGYLNDTWIWESWSGWVLQNITTTPPSADGAVMYYDPADSAMVLYGAGLTSSTWELYADNWWQVNAPAPPYRAEAGMVYDPSISALLLFGGANGSTYLNDAWEFAGGSWSDISAALGTPPVARAYPGLTLDPTGTVPFLFGGTNATIDFNDTWTISTLPTSSLGASPSSTEVTVPVTFTATVGSGVAPYVATFHFGDNVTAQVTGDGPTLVTTHAFVNPGTFHPSVNVTDSVGLTTSATTTAVTVGAGPAISASASPSTVDVGAAVTFSANATSPGAAPITYAWTFGDGNQGSGTSVSHSYTSAGTFGATVVGTDADGVESNASVIVLVLPAPTLTIGDNRSSASDNEPISFYANLSGGTPPYRFVWNFGDGNSSTFPSPSHVFTIPGNYTVQVWTNDSFSVMDHQSITVSIHAAPGQQRAPAQHETVYKNVTGGTPSWFYPAIGALVAILVIGAVVLLLRGRRKE